MALKPWTMSFKETNPEEVKLHEILASKTSPMAFAKDVLIEILVRGKYGIVGNQQKGVSKKNIETIDDDKDELDEILGM